MQGGKAMMDVSKEIEVRKEWEEKSQEEVSNLLM